MILTELLRQEQYTMCMRCSGQLSEHSSSSSQATHRRTAVASHRIVAGAKSSRYMYSWWGYCVNCRNNTTTRYPIMPAADYYMPWYTFSYLSGRIVCSRRNTLARGTWYVDGGGGGGGDNRARGIMPHICTAAHPPATEVVLIVRGRTFYIPIFQAARHYLAQRNAA